MMVPYIHYKLCRRFVAKKPARIHGFTGLDYGINSRGLNVVKEKIIGNNEFCIGIWQR